MNSLNEIAEWIRARDGFLLQGHVSPDGDTCGCCMALLLALRSMGKSAQAYIPGGPPKMLKFMKEPQALGADDKPEYRYSIALDVSDPDRLGDTGRKLFESAEGRIVVDHHGTNPLFGELNLVEGGRASCSEIMMDLIGALGAEITPLVASWLFVGISSDTGNMNYSNTDSACMRAAARCLDAGAKADELTKGLFRTRSLGRTKLLGLALCAMKIEGSVAYTFVTQDMLREAEAGLEDTESIVNYLLETEGVKVAILATEKEEGRFKLSLRSERGIDVAEAIAGPLGGGGHENAAGCTVEGTREHVLDTVLPYARSAGERG